MVEVSFEMIPQVPHEHWCWAAVTASVWQHVHQAAKPMCEVVCQKVGGQCCDVPTPAECEVESFLDEALGRLSLLRQPTCPGPLPLAAAEGEPSVESEIAAGRPIGVCINFGGRGHYCVIVGCDASARLVSVADPWYPPSPQHDYEQFVTAYQGSGAWFETYLLP